LFLDETWTHTAFTRLYGRGPRGQRVIGYVPAGHWQTTTFLAAFRQDGFTAPLVIDGAVNGALFRAYVEQHLAPTLRPGGLGSDGQLELS
jgi:enoyl reductase-like protein